jgi:hypothetical protein
MEQLATAIVDGAHLIQQIFVAAANGEGNIVALDQQTLLDGLSSIVQNMAAFLTQLVGEIIIKL